MCKTNEDSTLSTRHGMEEKDRVKEEKGETRKTVPVYKLFSFADSRDKFLMTIGTIGAFGNGMSQPLLAVLFGELIDAFGKSQSKENTVSLVSKVSLKFVYMALGCGVAAFLQVACWMVTGERQAARFRNLYLKSMLKQDIGYFDKEVSTGEVIERMSGDTLLIQEAMGDKVGKLVQVVASFLGGFLVAFLNGWLLTLVMMSSVPFIVISGGITYILRCKMAYQAQKAHATGSIIVQQTISSIRTVASFTGEAEAVAKYKKLLLGIYKLGVKEGLSTGLGYGSFLFIIFCSYALAFWFGTKMILHNGYTGGQVFTVILAVIYGSTALSQASPSMNALANGQAAAYKMFEIINRKPQIDPYDTKGKILDDIRGDIELRDICFSYPTRPKDQIFNGFSLFISSGTTVSLVGQSGSGKSTIISLIERFYDPHSGEILIDGIDLKEFQLKWIRSKIGLVSQEPVLFTGSIKDNIAYGKDGATAEEIKAAAELANASDFINKLPQGFDTPVGENGIKLSGGQKQRVAIARAILKDPRILLLDEATSALDAQSEKMVQEALDKVMANRTTVIVAHRLSTIQNANEIAVLHQGKIVEQGTHLKLLEDPQGVYSNLIRSQEINKDDEQCVDSIREPETSVKSRRMSSTSRGLSDVINAIPATQTFSNNASSDKNVSSLETSKKPPQVSISRLAYLNKPELPVLIGGTIFAIISGTVMPIFGLVLANIVKSFYDSSHNLKQGGTFGVFMFIVLGVASLIAYSMRIYLFGVAGNKLIMRSRLNCFENVVNMEISWFDKPENSSGVIGSRLSADATLLRALLGDALSQFVQEISSAAIGLAIAFAANWQLTLVVFALVPLVGLCGYVQFKSINGFSKDAKVKYEKASQVANDAVGSIRTVASFCAQERTVDLYKNKCEGPIANGSKQGVICGIGFGLSLCLMNLAYGAIFYVGARFVEEGIITFSEVFRVFYALNMVTIAISHSNAIAPDSSKAKNAAASIFAILDRKSKIDPSDESGITLESVKGDIELKHISFTYPTRPTTEILGDLSLTIHSGQIVALVGESGSGKSTVISLLQRFYDPDSGHITLDGIEIDKFQVKWLRQQMGLVSQEPILFNDTIRANIAFGKDGNASEAEIIAAAKLANAHEFISGLQQGYDAIVGERGIQLSGGQKQRVAIARAILKSPKILLLDEATSALDVESEKIVQDALDRVMLNRTTIVVAHRLSTIKGADIIGVVKNGRIVEEGNHSTLISIKDGYYSSLVRLRMHSTSS